jgi:endonuclease-8
MPEGDTIFRAARTLHLALAGEVVTGFDAAVAPLSDAALDAPIVGRTVEAAEARGKHLLLRFSAPPGAQPAAAGGAQPGAPHGAQLAAPHGAQPGARHGAPPAATHGAPGGRAAGALVLRSHMRMNGSWHLYRPGERWRRPRAAMRVVVETRPWVAVGFDLPVVELLREGQVARQRDLRRLGPDLLAAAFDAGEAERRLRARPHAEIGDALLDQSALAGIGNVFKS